MAWTDVKIELDKVKTAVDLTQTSADVVTVSDPLERVDASNIQANCDKMIATLQGIRMRANDEQELTTEEVSRSLLGEIKKSSDCVVTHIKDVDGLRKTAKYSSVKVGSTGTLTFLYAGKGPNRRQQGTTLKTEAI